MNQCTRCGKETPCPTPLSCELPEVENDMHPVSVLVVCGFSVFAAVVIVLAYFK